MATPTVYQCPLCEHFHINSYNHILAMYMLQNLDSLSVVVFKGASVHLWIWSHMITTFLSIGLLEITHLTQLWCQIMSSVVNIQKNHWLAQHQETTYREDNFSSNEHNECIHSQANNQCTTQDSMVQPTTHFKSQAAVWILKTKANNFNNDFYHWRHNSI